MWLGFGVGAPKQFFIIKKVGNSMRGMVCGTCDNPYTMAALDDFRIDGDTLTFNILHEDWGDGEIPTFDKHVTARVGWNEMRCTTTADHQPHATSSAAGSCSGILTAGAGANRSDIRQRLARVAAEEHLVASLGTAATYTDAACEVIRRCGSHLPPSRLSLTEHGVRIPRPGCQHSATDGSIRERDADRAVWIRAAPDSGRADRIRHRRSHANPRRARGPRTRESVEPGVPSGRLDFARGKRRDHAGHREGRASANRSQRRARPETDSRSTDRACPGPLRSHGRRAASAVRHKSIHLLLVSETGGCREADAR